MKQGKVSERSLISKAQRESDDFINHFNLIYPDMRAYKPLFDFNEWRTIKIAIKRRGKYKVAEVHFSMDYERYRLITEIWNCLDFGTLEDLISSQSFINCLKPNAYKFILPDD